MDSLFYRPLVNGTPYNSLIATSNFTTVELDDGDTSKSIELMKTWTLKHYKQVKKLSETLKGNRLEDTVKNIKQWLYNAIQYKKDGTEQLLRSPARAWKDRYDGIDCKSYSIFASSLLLNLGITHYFRMIKQKSLRPEQFSHIYVIVPVNQKTGNLNQGYFTVDGTIQGFNEPNFTEKHDLIMKHYGLNGIDIYHDDSDFNGLACACNDGLNSNYGDSLNNSFKNNFSTALDFLGTGIKSIFDTKQAKYTSEAEKLKAQTALAIANANTIAANSQSEIDKLKTLLDTYVEVVVILSLIHI